MTSIGGLLHRNNPYDGFNEAAWPSDLQGWGSDERIFGELIARLRPSRIVEVGTWKGRSAINMARICAAEKIDCEILCIDTWLGSPGLYTRPNDPFRADLDLRYGYPTLYYAFLANVVRAGCEQVIVPFALPSQLAAEVLRHFALKFNLAYIDAAHDYNSACDDMRAYWELLADDGVMLGDDYAEWPGVAQAANEFAFSVDRPIYQADGKFIIPKRPDFALPGLVAVQHNPAPAAAPGGASVWVAQEPTYLKRAPTPANTQPTECKIAVAAGDAVVAERYELRGGHTELIDVTISGLPLGPSWFVFTPHWRRHGKEGQGVSPPGPPTGVPPASFALRGTSALVPRSASDAGGTPVGVEGATPLAFS